MFDEDDRGDWEHDMAKDKELDRRWEEAIPKAKGKRRVLPNPQEPDSFTIEAARSAIAKAKGVRKLTLELSRCAALMDITAATLNVLQASDKNTANLARLIDNLLDARDDANKAINEAMESER